MKIARNEKKQTRTFSIFVEYWEKKRDITMKDFKFGRSNLRKNYTDIKMSEKCRK
jgi:hypothetical protein